jgi:hypothetical protein
LDRLQNNLLPGALFPEKPRLSFVPEQTRCPRCHHPSLVLKTITREVAAFSIGHFIAHETQRYCPYCPGPVFLSEELHQMVSPGARYAYDVIVTVGEALFVRCRNGKEIQHELAERNINISLREIDHLGQRFIIYLALAHEESQEKLKALMGSRGGYILHLDGTCEGDSPHLMTTIDELSKIVLGNVKLPSENAAQLIPYLRTIKQAYGEPIAMVHDMGAAILNAIKEVFPKIPDYICHFHFLKDIGKDLFGHDYTTIRRHLKTHAIRSHLRKTAKGLKKAIDADPDILHCLHDYLETKPLHEAKMPLMPLVMIYLIICWVLEAKQGSHGFGFPFDRPHFDFYHRLQEAYPDLQRLKPKMANSATLLPLAPISKMLSDQALAGSVLRMQDKVGIFDQLRGAMRIAQPDNGNGLNDEGDLDITTIKERVTRFRHSEKIKALAATNIAYRKMVKQIDKYWDKLFADPIQVVTNTGIVTLQPQRTNNILEQFFRDLKRSYRKRSGNHALSKTLKTMMAQTPLVKNLDNLQYMEIILNGKASLAQRFAEIDIIQVRKAHTEVQGGWLKFLKYPIYQGNWLKQRQKGWQPPKSNRILRS